MRVHFKIEDVFPATDPIAQFLVGLGIIINDVTLVAKHMVLLDQTAGKSELHLYYLYQTCAHYREAAKYLDQMLKEPAVSDFLQRLSPEGQQHLENLRESFTPWDTSFVKTKLDPVRNLIFHYTPFRPRELESHLAGAAEIESWIELGQGTYAETRYAFCDEVVTKYVTSIWGTMTEELTEVMTQMRELVLALTFFGHEAIALRLEDAGPIAFRVVD